jgi:hypothetical protein
MMWICNLLVQFMPGCCCDDDLRKDAFHLSQIFRLKEVGGPNVFEIGPGKRCNGLPQNRAYEGYPGDCFYLN